MPEYLVALGERMEDREIELLETFALTYTAGSLHDKPFIYEARQSQ